MNHKGERTEIGYFTDPRFLDPAFSPGAHRNDLCEHSLSLDLCEGPNHYPADNPYDDEPPF